MASEESQRHERWLTWLIWWTCLCLPAFGVAFIKWGALTTFYVTVGVAFLTTLVVIGLRDGRGSSEDSLRAKVIHIVRVSLFATVSLFSVMMIAQALGALWLLFLAVMGATTPPAVAFVRRTAGEFTKNTRQHKTGESHDSDETAANEPDPAPVDNLQSLTDVELCCLWRHSFWDLKSATSADARAQIVMYRQEILDELTRRNAAAVAAWLASGARASSSPERFFNDGDSGQPAAA